MILTVDVGLRNLAICCMSSSDKTNLETYKIHLWDVYNILNTDNYKCESIQKSGKVCGKKCKFKYKESERDIYCCKIHFPKNLDCKLKKHSFKKKAIKNYLLQDIALSILVKIQEIYDNNLSHFDIKNIYIELQPKINTKAIFTSHIIYGKLVELYKYSNVSIKFVKAVNKLKIYKGPFIECKLKNSYSRRKWLSIQYITWFLEYKFSKEQKDIWLDKFLNSNKKDDKSDTALMAIDALYS